jgi:hypothetical protein
MLYIATMGRNRLVKVGVTFERREQKRLRELQRTWRAPELRIVHTRRIPHGWGEEEDWERALIDTLRRTGGNLQLFAPAEGGREIVDCTTDDALESLDLMLRRTEVDPNLDADALEDGRADWRFCNEFMRRYPESECVTTSDCRHFWNDIVLRQAFVFWLRGDVRQEMPPRIFRLDQERQAAATQS